MNLYNFLLEHSQDNPDKPYCYTHEETITYGQLCQRAEQLAGQLCGDPQLAQTSLVAVSSDDNFLLLHLVWACLRAGICLAFLPASSDSAELKKLMSQIGATVLLTDRPNLQPAPWIKNIHLTTHVKIAGAQSHSLPPLPTVPSAPAFIFQTSGTTGTAKWVQVTQAQYVLAIKQMQLSGGLDHASNQVVYNTLPLSHSYGLSSLLEYTACGATIMLPQATSSLGAVGTLLAPKMATRITAIEGVSHFYSQMVRLLGRIHLPNLRHIGFGGGAIQHSLIDRLQQVFPTLTYSIRYGLTETPSVVTHKRFAPPYTDDWNASGRVLPIYTLKIVDQTGQCVPDGEEGEILIKGACLAWPYYGEPASNDFFATGDIGYLNSQQELCLIGRKSSFLKIHGYRISPAYIESLIDSFDAVLASRVSAENDLISAEIIPAFPTATPQAIQAYLTDKLPNYAIPTTLHFVEKIPRTASGKIKRLC
ncbi:MAG TPA: long-chain fatty acid--CoA ligase [Anaerolineae bacterium]|nr:long-chain fatty acid--CoA ligase [Anaerolineae bacterium]